jgi:membrane protease YdiL (CAAX protease family)
MTKNPLLNAALAAIYIIGIVHVMNAVTSLGGPPNSVLVPMAVLSLFTLSTAVMGYLFLYEPFKLYSDNHKEEALVFFLKTVGTFAVFTLIFVASLVFVARQS